jgi:hypothetical protein
MAQTRGAGTPQAVRLPGELLERIDRYAGLLGEAILAANEPRVSWEELKAGYTPSVEQLRGADDARPGLDQP